MPSDLITERYHYSMTRLTELQNRVKHIEILSRFPQLTIYAAGSYARMEASKHSDIDLFFLHSGKKSDLDGTRMDQQRLFAKLVEIADMMDFPEFTNDGQYLQILFLDDMLRQLGGRHDDYVNHFTARMLLLLESYPIFNKPVYSECIAKIVESYFRDYKDFPSSFRPTFLVNDILRFWKTLCLNYEYERNIAETRTGDAIKHTVKNFKLKFSRMLTCFATVIALTKHREPITQQEVIDLIQFPPRMRLDQVIEF